MTEQRNNFPRSAEEFEAAIAKGVQRGVRDVFVMLGIDIYDADSVSMWHQQQGWVRDQVTAAKEGRVAQVQGRAGFQYSFWLALIPAGVAGAVTFLISWIKGTH